MITISKKLIASILIIAMIITNSGVSVFADSVSNIVQKEKIISSSESYEKENGDDKEAVVKDNIEQEKTENIEESEQETLAENVNEAKETEESLEEIVDKAEESETDEEQEKENSKIENEEIIETEIATESEIINEVEEIEFAEATESDIKVEEETIEDETVATPSDIEKEENTERAIATTSDIDLEEALKELMQLIATNSEIATVSIIIPRFIATESALFGTTYPTSFDYRNYNGKNYVTSLKAQGQSNICEVFAMVSGAETYMLYHYGDYVKNMIGNEELNFSELNILYDRSNGVISPIVGREKSISARGDYYKQGSSSVRMNSFYWSKVGGVLEKYAPFSEWNKNMMIYLPYNDGSHSLATLMNSSHFLINRDEHIEEIKKAVSERKAVSIGEPANTGADMIVSKNAAGEEVIGYDMYKVYDGSSGHEMNLIAYDDNMPESWTGTGTKGGIYVKDSSRSNDKNEVFSYKQLKDLNFGGEIYDFEPTKYNFDNNYFYATDMGDELTPDATVTSYVFTLDGNEVLGGEETVYGFGINGNQLDIEVFELSSSTDIENDEMTFDVDYMSPIFSESFERDCGTATAEHSTFILSSTLKLDKNHKYAFKISPTTTRGISRSKTKIYEVNDVGEGFAVETIPDFSILTNSVHNVRYDANGGKFSNNSRYKDFTVKNNDTINIEQPTYEGMRFIGWSNKKNEKMLAGLETKYHACYGETYYAIWEAVDGNKEHTFSRQILNNIAMQFYGNSDLYNLSKVSFQIAGNVPDTVTDSFKIDNSGFVAYKNVGTVVNKDGVFPDIDEIILYAPNGSTINLVPKSLFADCYGLQEITGLNNCSVTGQTDFSNMFEMDMMLQGNLDLSSFDTRSATNMSKMFCGLDHVGKIYVGPKFDVSGVTNSENMFENAFLDAPIDMGIYNQKDKTYAHIGGYLWDAFPKIEFDESAVFAYGYEQTNGTRYYNEEYILPLGDYASDAQKELIRWKDGENNTFVTVPKGYDKDLKLIPEYNNSPYQGVADTFTIPIRTKYGRANPLKIRKGGYLTNVKQVKDCIEQYDSAHLTFDTVLLHLVDGGVNMQSKDEPLGESYLEDIEWIEPVWKIEYENEHLLNHLTFRPIKTGTYRTTNKTYHMSDFLSYYHSSANNNGANINIIFTTMNKSAYGESNLTYSGKTFSYRVSPDDKGFRIYSREESNLIEILMVIPTNHKFKIQKTAYNHKFGSLYSYVLYHFNEFSRSEVRERITAINGLENVIFTNSNELNGDYSELTRDDLLTDGSACNKTIRGMFEGCTKIENLNLVNFDFTDVQDMSNLFKGCTKLKTVTFSANQMNKWKEVTNFQNLFSGCSSLQSINLYNFSSNKVTNASNMFNGCSALTTIKVNKYFNLSNVSNASNIFNGCNNIKGGENSGFVSGAKQYAKIDGGSTNKGYFTDADKKGSVAHITYNLNEGEWVNEPSEYVQSGVTSVTLPTELDIKREGYTFKGWYDNAGCTGTSIKTLTISSSKTEYPLWVKWEEIIPQVGYYVLPYGWYNETGSGKSPNLVTKITLEKNPTPAPTNADGMWEITGSYGLKGYIKGTEITIYAPENKPIYAPADSDHLFSARYHYDDVGKEYQADYLNFFARCESIENLHYLDTSNVTNMNAMFQGVGMYNVYGDSIMPNGYPSNLNDVITNPKKTVLDVSTFDTSNVIDMRRVFEISAVEEVDVSNFDTSKVTNMRALFAQAGLFKEIDISSWNMSKVTNANSMFTMCLSLEKIDMTGVRFDSASDYRYMFYNCPNLERIYASDTFFINSSATTDSMFANCPKLEGGRGTKIDGNPVDGTYARLDKDGVPGYFSKVGEVKFLKEIEVIRESSKTKYKVDEKYDPSGLKISMNYSDLSNTEVEYNDSTKSGFTFRPSLETGLKKEDKEVEIGYAGKVATQSITVIELNGITVEASPSKLRYLKGEHFDPTGLKIKLNNSDNVDEFITYTDANKNDFKFNNETDLILNTLSLSYAVTIEYLGKTATLDIVVAELDHIEVITEPTKLDYLAGQYFNPEGLEIRLVYTDNVTKTTTYNNTTKSKFSFNPPLTTALTVTDEEVTISYEGKDITQAISVLELIGISMVATPTTLEYISGQRLDPTGLIIKAAFKDKNNVISYKTITYDAANTNNIIFNPNLNTSLNERNRTVTINYEGKTLVYNITVERRNTNSNNSLSSSGGSVGRSITTEANQNQNQNKMNMQVTVQANIAVNNSQYGTKAAMNMAPIANIKTNFVNNKMTFTKENGEKIQGLQKVSVNNTEGIYYFNNDSTLYCGLMKDENNNLHYFGIDGKMLTNTTLSIGTTQFVINENGEVDQNRFSNAEKMQIFSNCGMNLYTGDVVQNTNTGTWSTYITNPVTGQKELAKGLVQLVQEDGVNTYYFDSFGVLQTGYIIINGQIRCFNPYNGRLMF